MDEIFAKNMENAETDEQKKVILNVYFVSIGIRPGFLLQYETKEGKEYGEKIATEFGLGYRFDSDRIFRENTDIIRERTERPRKL